MTSRFRRARLAASAVIAAAAIGLVSSPAAQAAPTGTVNGDFEAGNTGWFSFSTPFGGAQLINNSSTHPAHSGNWKAELGGRGYTGVNRITQQVTIPANRVPVLTFWLRIDPQGPGGLAYRELDVEAVAQDGTPYLLTSRTNKDGNSAYEQVTITLPDAFYSSTQKTATISFMAVEDSANKVPFLIDDVSMAYRLKMARPWLPPLLHF
ncbi:hypothetical protein F7Q99_13950 [Streptomyces kaniharaensis]|uniref:CBM-cenC domain-containing protein n=1 Tax=Streptomyces kaniharaensis TaxID=212423 RepID=A0A6N7KRY2_9ACTN|nr:hypothetical protein [Streptomyces kaniharaensis]MQS13349.1 hypothetical protein [Streptomyces kaniharaensis]